LGWLGCWVRDVFVGWTVAGVGRVRWEMWATPDTGFQQTRDEHKQRRENYYGPKIQRKYSSRDY